MLQDQCESVRDDGKLRKKMVHAKDDCEEARRALGKLQKAYRRFVEKGGEGEEGEEVERLFGERIARLENELEGLERVVGEVEGRLQVLGEDVAA